MPKAVVNFINDAVWINTRLDMAPHMPFGGSKHFGIGVEFGEEGLAEFTRLQVIKPAR